MPAALSGAWSLSGKPADSLLTPSERGAMLAAAGPGVQEVRAGRLWLACEPSCLARDDRAITAWDGSVFFGPEGPSALAAFMTNAVRPETVPPGHYVAVHAPLGGEAVSLLRDPTGGERLYFQLRGDALIFSSSLKALLPAAGRIRLDAEIVRERGLSELVHFGDRTLVEGVREVLPGHRLTVENGRVRQDWVWGGLLKPVEGGVPDSARAFRRVLTEAIARCIGRDGKAAVALSGGLDSAAVAALAAEVVGARNVFAFTFEYQDRGHPSEVPYAEEVCRRLGMPAPEVVPITIDGYMDAIPEAVWKAEDFAYWKRAYTIALARAAKAAGFDRFLTGFGIGSHMAALEEIPLALSRLPLPQWSLRYWASACEMFPGRLGALARVHPGLEPPVFRLYYFLLCVLRRRGVLSDLRPYFPPELGAIVEELASSLRISDALRETSGLSLAEQLQFLAFTHMNSCVDVARSERIARHAGAAWLGQAHFPSSLPLCYLPVHPRPPVWDARRRMRPGKLLITEAMRGILPEAIIERKKYWRHANGSQEWRERALARMDAAAGPSWDVLRDAFGTALGAAKRFSPEGMIPLAFWHRVLLSGARSSPPSWAELEG